MEGHNECLPPRESITEAREALPQEGDLFSPTSPQKLYKSSWENQKAKGFELRLDSLGFLAAKANRDLASEVSQCSTCTAWPRILPLSIWESQKGSVQVLGLSEPQRPICEVGRQMATLQ